MRLVILGAGGYGRTVADIALQTGEYDRICFLDDHSDTPGVIGICCDFAQMIGDKTAFYPAFGNNEARMGWLHRLMKAGCNVPTVIHPTAYVSPTARVMPGAVILPHAIVSTDCEIKAGCIVNCGAIIDHDCVLEVGVHICPGAIVKAENRIPRCMKIEAGEVVQNRTYPL